MTGPVFGEGENQWIDRHDSRPLCLRPHSQIIFGVDSRPAQLISTLAPGRVFNEAATPFISIKVTWSRYGRWWPSGR